MRGFAASILAFTACGSPATHPGDGSPGDDGGKTDDGTTTGDDAAGDDASTGADAPEPPSVWRPMPGTSWQWQLTGTIDTHWGVAMYDTDLDVPQTVRDQLRADGRIVICYFSAGSLEDWRDDIGDVPAEAIGNVLDGWPDEHWLDIRHPATRDLVTSRLDRAVAAHCDGVEPDNVDGFDNDPGFPLTAADQLDFNRFIATEAHARGLSVGLKNDVDQIDDLVASFDWALDEECVANDECDKLAPVIAASRAVFHVEYGGSTATICAISHALGFDTLIKDDDVGPSHVTCP
jgi:hypothetical protein